MSETKQPKTGAELAMMVEADPYEGVQVALFPEAVSQLRVGESFGYEPGVTAYPVIATLGPWGERLMDVVTEPPRAIKWWKVRDYAKDRGCDLVPVRWAGAIADIPERYFEGGFLGIRFFNEGPWFFPLEKPELATQEQELLGTAVDAAIGEGVKL